MTSRRLIILGLLLGLAGAGAGCDTGNSQQPKKVDNPPANLPAPVKASGGPGGDKPGDSKPSAVSQ